jgi:Protein of unknown function (DUF1403)
LKDKTGAFDRFFWLKAPVKFRARVNSGRDKRKIKTLAADHPIMPLSPVPRWARLNGAGSGEVEVAFRTGAALAQLHLRVMAEPPFAGAWRRRLALKAAEASSAVSRRGAVDQAILRDQFYLRKETEALGPGGRLVEAWRALDRTAPLGDEAIATRDTATRRSTVRTKLHVSHRRHHTKPTSLPSQDSPNPSDTRRIIP